jgi:hypothetical protein
MPIAVHFAVERVWFPPLWQKSVNASTTDLALPARLAVDGRPPPFDITTKPVLVQLSVTRSTERMAMGQPKSKMIFILLRSELK